MPERLVLHPASHLVEATVRDAHHMKRVRDTGRVIEMRRQSRPEALGEIGGDDLDAGEPCRIRVGGPSPQVSRRVALDHVDHDAFLEIDQASRVDRRMCPVRAQERGLVDPELRDRAHPFGIVDEWRAVLDHRVHDRPPTHPELVGDLRHRPGVLTDLAARLHPRPAGDHRLRVDMLRVFVHVFASHNASRQRHRRLRHTNRAGRPKHARSRTSTALRSCASARVPAPAQPATRTTVSTMTTSSSAFSVTSRTRNPSQSQQRFRQPDTVAHAGVSSSSQPSAAATMTGPLPQVVDPVLPIAPYTNRRAPFDRYTTFLRSRRNRYGNPVSKHAVHSQIRPIRLLLNWA